MVVVRLQKFGGRRMLPIEDVAAWGGVLRAPFTCMQIEDAPEVEGGVHKADDPYRALAYWRFEDQGGPAILTPAWRRSSGFFVTERPFPTNPSPTPSVS